MNDSFATTVSAESMLMEDVTQSVKGGVRSLSDLFKDGSSDSSLDFFAGSSSDFRSGSGVVTSRPKDLLRNHNRRDPGKRASKGAAGSISDLLDSSDSCDFNECQVTSNFPLQKAMTPRKSRRENVTRSRGDPPTMGNDLEERPVSSPGKKSLRSYLAKNGETTRTSIVEENTKGSKDLGRSSMVKVPAHDKVTKNRRRDAPPRGAMRLPSMDNAFMDSWRSRSSDSCESNQMTPLYPYLQAADTRKPVKGCDASVVSEISGISWSSGVSSLSMSSEDHSLVPDFSHTVNPSKEPCIRHSLDEALQGSFNFIEDAVPKRPARRRTPSPSRSRTRS